MSAIVSKEGFAIDVDFEGADACRRPAIIRWPVLACAFIATAAATGAFLESPLATHPTVAPYVTTAVSSVTGAFDGALAILR